MAIHLEQVSTKRALMISNITKEIYPAVIVVVFVVLFIAYGIVNAPDGGDIVKVHAMRGPEGRPLPVRRKSANQLKAAVEVKDFSASAKTILRSMQVGVLATFLINAGAVILQTLIYRGEQWWAGQATVIYIIASFFGWAIIMVSLIDTKPSPTWVHLTTWLIAVPLDLLILFASLHIYRGPHHEPKVGDQTGGKLRLGPTPWELLEIILYIVRNGLLLGMIFLYTLYKISAQRSHTHGADHETRQPLLGESGQANGNGHAYGAVEGQKPEQRPQQDAWAKPTETPNLSWYSYIRGFIVLLPYLWPRKSVKLQMLALICFMIMVAQRVINVFVPILTGDITDALSGDNGQKVKAPWLLIALYILFRWLQGGQGILSAARSILWIPVEQYSYRAISTAAFEHVHGLSAEFHTGKRTGELISALNKGSAINSFLEMVTFNVGPMIFDLIVAIIYLATRYDVYLSLVVAIVTFLYVYVTIRLAAWRVQLRRNFTNADREMEAVKNDSLHSWDTVKYFNAEKYEFDRYRSSIKVMQGFEYWVDVTLAYMNTIQGALFMVALLIAAFIEAFQVAQGYESVGKFITLITYMAQLQAPLNFFGTFYRAIQNNLINAERMLELFKEQPVVVDKPDAESLKECEGEIVFDDINFSYDKKKNALNSLSFRCASGTTTALVGESGGGKTTIMRLLFRYYNPDTGEIRIDNKSVEDITIDSIRKHIGVVPQDCNMFNESIMYNLRYANQNATEKEIFDACRAASIHDRIMLFNDGYDTKVGERGVRLSGGERQRVAIARTILKNPKIILLDEATAALDTETEERIQEAFKSLSHGRTMLIIAHRLSTIVDADQILVLNGGTVVETGTHNELLEMDGKYASMWRKQSRAQKAAAEAEELRTRAKKALEDAEVDSANASEEEIERANARRAFYSSSKKGTISQKKVNFTSQSSLTKGWTLDSDKTDEHDTPSGDPAGSGNNGGKPPGHP